MESAGPIANIDIQSFVGAYKDVLKKAHGLNSPVVRAAEFDVAPFEHILACGQETFVGLSRDRVVARELYATGHFELEKLDLATRLCGRKLETIVDVGANIGVTCIPAVRRGYVNRGIAIEPDTTNFRLLMANLFINDLQDKIVAFNIAAGAIDGESLELELSEDNMGDHRIRRSTTQGQFNEAGRRLAITRSETLDTLLASLSMSDLGSTLVWIDTQGYEGFVLKGASRVIASRCPLVLEFWPYGLKRANCFSMLLDALTVSERNFYVLSDPNPQPFAATRSALERLFSKIGEDMSFVDLLLI